MLLVATTPPLCATTTAQLYGFICNFLIFFAFLSQNFFCRECLVGAIEHSDTSTVGCPYKDDDFRAGNQSSNLPPFATNILCFIHFET